MPDSQADAFSGEDFDFDESADDEEAIAGAVSAPQRHDRPTLSGTRLSAPPAQAASSASNADHQKALYDAQLAMQALQEENRRLRMEHSAALQLARTTRSGKARGKKKPTSSEGEDEPRCTTSTPNELQPLLKLIRFHGRQYSVCVRPWPPPRMTWSYPERPSVDPLDRETRYLLHRNVDELDISLAIDEAMCAELYDIIPSLLHPHMRNEFLIKEFSAVVLDQKCKALCNGRVARKHIFKSIAGHIDLNLFDANDPKVIQDDPALITWRSTHDNVYPPVIFPPDKAGKRAYVFRSEPIAQFIRMMLYGKGAITAKPGKKFIPRKNCAARQWNITEISVGMIAFAAVAVRHLLLPEEAFDSVGLSSEVTYEVFFNEYVKLLICKWESVRLRETRAWLDTRVFKGLRPEVAGKNPLSNPGVHSYVDLYDLDELDELSANEDDSPTSVIQSAAPTSGPAFAPPQSPPSPVTVRPSVSSAAPAPGSAPSQPSGGPARAPEPAPLRVPGAALPGPGGLNLARAPAVRLQEALSPDAAETLAAVLNDVSLAGELGEHQTDSAALETVVPAGQTTGKPARRGRGGGRVGRGAKKAVSVPLSQEHAEEGHPVPVPQASDVRPTRARTTRSKTAGA